MKRLRLSLPDPILAVRAMGLPASLLGCHADTSNTELPAGVPTNIAFQTAHFTYYSDTPVCDELGARMEDNYARTSEMLGVVPPEHIRYFFVGESGDLSEACEADEDVGCFLPSGDIVARMWFSRHEAVHAYLSNIGSPPKFFQEGVAEVFGPQTGDGYLRVTRSLDASSILDGSGDVDYAAAASFCRSIIEVYGLDRFMQLYSALTGGDVDAAFMDALGVSLDDALSGWEHTPSGYRGDSYFWLDECSANGSLVLPAEGEETLIEPGLSCAEVALDMNRVPGQAGAYLPLSVSGRQGLRLRIAAEALSGITMARCDGYLEGEPGVAVSAAGDEEGAELWTTLDPGDYYVAVWQSGGADEASTITLGLTTASGLSSSCDDAGTVMLDGESAFLRLDGEVGSTGFAYANLISEVNATFSLEAAAFPVGDGLPSAGAISAALCRGDCDTLTQCESVGDSDSHLTLEAGVGYVLVVEFAPDSHVTVDLSLSARP